MLTYSVRPLKEEFKKVIDIIFTIFKALDFKDFTAQVSLRDPKNTEKYIGTDENWEKAERAIIEAAEEKGLKTTVELGEAAFYGPKLDFMVKDAIGRKWQLGTIQVDYNLPERFDLEYTGKYMAWCYQKTSGASSYTTMLCFSQGNSIYTEQGLHLGCDFYGEWNTLYNIKLSGVSSGGYSAFTGTIPIIMNITDKGNGAISWTYSKLQVKNGIIVGYWN